MIGMVVVAGATMVVGKVRGVRECKVRPSPPTTDESEIRLADPPGSGIEVGLPGHGVGVNV